AVMMLSPHNAVFSQTLPPAQKPAFEVASIKPNTSGSRTTSSGFQGCRFVGSNATLKMMILSAYRLPNGSIVPMDHLIGGASWIDFARFDVEAKPEVSTASLPLQQLLL